MAIAWRVASVVARVAHRDAESLAALHRRRDHLAAQCSRDHLLHIADTDAVAGQFLVIRLDVQVEAACESLGERTGRSGNVLHRAFDFLCQPLDLAEVATEDLDADRRADPRRQHVGPCPDRHRPGVGDAGQLNRLVHFGDQLVGRHARPPLRFGLQVDHRLEHLDRSRVGCRDGAPRLPEDRLDLRKALDDPVLRLQQFGGLGHRHAGQSGRHVEQRPFVQRRHELGAQARCRDPRDDENHDRRTMVTTR